MLLPVVVVTVLSLVNRRRCVQSLSLREFNIAVHWLLRSRLALCGALLCFWGYPFPVWVRSGFSAVLTPCGSLTVHIRAGSVRGYRPFSLRELRVLLAIAEGNS